jgi:hypothetical protein
MLSFVATPIAAYRPLEHRHKWLLQVLVSFAGRDGRCWPSLPKIAEQAGATLAWVQRNLAEMEKLALFSRKRRFGESYVYTIAARFLPRWPGKSARLANSAGVSPVQTLDAGPKEEDQESDLRNKGELVRLSPPPEASPAEPAPKRPAKPVQGPNPFARRAWLRKLNTFIGEHFHGAQQWAGWEVVAKAEAGPLDPAEQRLLDGFDRMMRGPGLINHNRR